MFEPFERDVDKGFEESVRMFEKAHIGEVAPTPRRRPKHVLLVLDGSSQDETATQLAGRLKERFQCSVTVCDARFELDTNDDAEQTAASLGVGVLPKEKGESFDQVLAGIDKSECDLVLLPCPYGRDLESVGSNSTGTVIDVLLSRSPVPLLVVRKPYEPERAAFQRVLLVLIGENEAAPLAAEWAAGLVAPGGRSELALILEEEFYENLRDLMAAIAPDVQITSDVVRDALAKTHMRLHRGLQKAAQEAGVSYKLSVWREGDPGGPRLEEETAHPLIVLALERADHLSQGHVHDRIRKSPNPLLVVPIDD